MKYHILAALALGVSGCSSWPPEALGLTTGGIELASVVNTHKTVSDHVYSLVTGKDCSVLYQRGGHAMCREDDPPPRPQPVVYCYRSLATNTCYGQPQPAYQPVGMN